MPLRGESIGTAYVRVLADASGFPDSVRDQLNEADKKFDDAGSVGAKRYKKAFAEEMDSHTGRTLDDALSDALAREDFSKEFFDGPGWKKFETNMHARFGGLGDDAARELREKFTKQGSLQGIEGDIEKVVARINANVDKAIRNESSAAAQAKKDMLDFETQFRRAMEDAENVSRKTSSDNVTNLERTRRSLESLRLTVGKFGVDFDKTRSKVTSFYNEIRKGEQDVERNDHVMIRLSQNIDHMADGIARGFGKGSRNNFVNFTGSFVGGAVKLLGIVPNVIGNLQELTDGFSAARKSGEGFFSSIQSGLGTMAKDAEGEATAFSKLLELGPGALLAIAGAAVLLISVLGPVAALISGIGAAIIALAGSVAFAVVGIVAPLVGLVAPLAVVLGVLAGTIFSIVTSAGDGFGKKIIDPLLKMKATLTDLGSAAVDTFTKRFGGGLDSIANKLRGLKPLFSAIGGVVGNIANQSVRWLDSDTANTFFQIMGNFAPEVLRRLSDITGNLLDAFTNIFIDLVPDVREMLKWLQKITREFADFVDKNPDKIRKFFDDAHDSLKAVAGFLDSIVGLTGTLLDKGKGTGDTIFTSLGKQVDKFNNFLKDNPDALKNFFKNGQNVADDLGAIAVSLAQIFGALDSDNARSSLDLILKLGSALDKLAGPIGFLADHPVETWLGFVFGPVAFVTPPIVKMIDDVARAIGKLDHIRLPNLNLFSKIKNLFGKGGGGTIEALTIKPPDVSWIPRVEGRIANFFGSISRGAANVTFGPLASAARTAADRVGGFFSALPGRLRRLSESFGGAASSWAATILSTVAAVPGEIIDFFRGLAGRILAVVGTIHIPVKLDVQGGLGRLTGGLIGSASGGVFDAAALRVIGEDGPEAVVPLNRPLDQVDPSVRWLSALAQGITPNGGMSSAGPGKTINNEFHITTPTTDVVGVAREVVNQLVASAY